MPNSAMLKVSWARASLSPSATFTAGITGKNRCTASGVISAIRPSAMVKARPGLRGFGCVSDMPYASCGNSRSALPRSMAARCAGVIAASDS